ncbi:DNA (cytosine-5)-methyltransferase CMT3 isoform X2 [Cryptomeria japonica]|uniref:DNA (cytosine-5)-methyltransferase CMT3 isoform X2 n=1 Tax=Cryptomeria japonica TaxID=3369 RepID=UPI0027DA6F40|nr:DNA (cytosine-5)-methyltransferase CMT3 isoform X2 [Cryptomeria japonica]
MSPAKRTRQSIAEFEAAVSSAKKHKFEGQALTANGSAKENGTPAAKENGVPAVKPKVAKENGAPVAKPKADKENGAIAAKENGAPAAKENGTGAAKSKTARENGASAAKENGASAAKENGASAAKENGTSAAKPKAAKENGVSGAKPKVAKLAGSDSLIGSPIPKAEAQSKWPWRYQDTKNKKKRTTGNDGDDSEEIILIAKAHYTQARVDGVLYNLGDCAFVKAEDGAPDYIGRIVEFFETADGNHHFTSQWFYRAEDTAIKTQSSIHEPKRVFLSKIKDVNLLECITSKLNIVQVPPVMGSEKEKRRIPPCDFYYDMGYDLPYTTFHILPPETVPATSDSSSEVCNEISHEFNGAIESKAQTNGSSRKACRVKPEVSSTELNGVSENKEESETNFKKNIASKPELKLLDLYSGCGGMSTGLCFGANLSGVNLVTRWALDLNEAACKSLKHNHPETEVRNESADHFLELLREWQKLCLKYCEPEDQKAITRGGRAPHKAKETKKEEESVSDSDSDVQEGEFEVEYLLDIRHIDPTKENESGLEFKVHWKGYDESEDTWEPLSGLGECEEKIKEFVLKSAKEKRLPLPGDVDVICGGPPCQGASGFNRFRNVQAPLDDPKNHQMVVYMDIVNFMRPRYVLMENVVDILKFCNGFLGRYALSRLIHMNYQARLGMMAAGCYGLPQFRMRAFLWGAKPSEKLPQYPLPTHDVVVRGGVPNEWEILNSENRDEMAYGKAPCTEFQRYIRMPKEVMKGQMSYATSKKTAQKAVLYDHRSLQLNEDDYQRVCRIPKRKGANFRDLPGVLVGPDNVVELDTSMERVLLPSGKPLVPDYAITFVKGRSTKPFGRLWWDETVPTVVTRAEPHNQAVLHPEQDRVLSIRENARLQGFPDYYKLYGGVKDRYIQVGNAVAVPVARALGFALGMAIQNLGSQEPVMELPRKFPHCFSDKQNGDLALDVGEQC